MGAAVSVIIPAYNCEQTVIKSISSALAQTLKPLEIIVIDDCSTDKTYDILQEFAQNESTLRILQNPVNSGAAETRNYGLTHVAGKFVAFLDSDDTWEPNKLEKQLEILKQMKADFSYTSYYITDNDNQKLYEVPATITYDSLLKENYIGCSTIMIHSGIMKTHKFSSKYFHEDYILWLELLREGKKAVGIQEPLVYYQKGGRSSDKINAAKNRWKIYRKIEKLTLMQSFYYIIHYIIHGIRKYF